QLALLDAYAGNENERRQVRRAAAAWQALVDESLALSQQGDVSDRIGFLEHQLRELDREDLEPESIVALVLVAGIGIQQGQLRRARQQGLLFVLAVDLH
ncbi:hypothetical protein ACEN9Z_24905, partial [Stenotrophomonas geniculata]